MSYFSSAFKKHFIGSGSVKTTGATESLAAGQIGIFDAKTFNALPVVGSNPKPNKMFIIAQGSMHSKDTRGGISHGGLQESVKSRPINPKYIEKFWVTEPSRPVADTWTIGYNGVTTCKPITGECGSKYTIRVDVRGESALRTYNRHLYRYFTVETPCCDDCDVTCDPAVADPYLLAKSFVEQINADVELSNFVRAELILETAIADSNQITYDKFILNVLDNGTPFDLADVQVAYPTYTIERESRAGIQSTYSVIVADGVTPASFTASAKRVSADACGVCPTGWTAGTEMDLEIRRTVLLPDADDDGGSTVSFEDALATLMGSQSTSGSLAKQYKDVLLTNLAAVDADVLTADLTVTPTLISTNNSVATISLNIKLVDATPSASLFTITLADITGGIAAVVTAVNTAEATVDVDDEYTAGAIQSFCYSPAATAIAWVADGSVYKTKRQLCVTLPKECGSSSSSLTEATAFFANNPNFTTVAQEAGDTDCAEVISVYQISNNYYEIGCLEKPIAQYDAVPSFKGIMFEECACVETSPYVSGAVGIRLTTAYEDTRFGDCSFNPKDYFNVAPLKLEVSKVDDAELCTDDHTQWSVDHLTNAKQPQGLGEAVLREYLLASNYRLERFQQDTRFREVTGQEHMNVINRESYYRTYYLLHSIPNSFLRGMNVTNYDEKYLLAFSFEENVDTTEFENLLAGYAALNDVELETV